MSDTTLFIITIAICVVSSALSLLTIHDRRVAERRQREAQQDYLSRAGLRDQPGEIVNTVQVRYRDALNGYCVAAAGRGGSGPTQFIDLSGWAPMTSVEAQRIAANALANQ